MRRLYGGGSSQMPQILRVGRLLHMRMHVRVRERERAPSMRRLENMAKAGCERTPR